MFAAVEAIDHSKNALYREDCQFYVLSLWKILIKEIRYLENFEGFFLFLAMEIFAVHRSTSALAKIV